MFEKITTKITKKIVNRAKETVKNEINIDSKKIIGIIAIGFAMYSLIGAGGEKTMEGGSTVIINNYYGPSQHLHML